MAHLTALKHHPQSAGRALVLIWPRQTVRSRPFCSAPILCVQKVAECVLPTRVG